MKRKFSKYLVDIVVGARPNFVKAASLVEILDQYAEIDVRLIHTGQHNHPALSDSFFEVLGLRKPDIHLETAGGSQAVQTGKVMTAYETTLIENTPDAVIVIGDVNSTLGAAIAAKKSQCPLLHLEAGLRSGDRNLPEEINRLAVDAISDRFWAPSQNAVECLISEGHREEQIFLSGNFMIDSLVRTFDFQKSPPLGLSPMNYGVVTLHRQSNVDDPKRLEAILTVLEKLSQKLPLIFPLHPRLVKFDAISLGPSIQWKDPMNYEDFLHLQGHAKIVITDSGGIQEETSFLGVPCLTLRDSTERPITVEQGTNILVNPENLLRVSEQTLATPRKPLLPIEAWDGKAAIRATADLINWLENLG